MHNISEREDHHTRLALCKYTQTKRDHVQLYSQLVRFVQPVVGANCVAQENIHIPPYPPQRGWKF